jgi:Sortase domain
MARRAPGRPAPARSRLAANRRGAAIGLTLCTMLGLVGAGFLVAGLSGIGSGPPQPPYPAPVPGATVWASSVRLPGLGRSEPVRIDIPDISVHAGMVPVGVGPGNAIGVPPLSQPDLTGWYRYGRTPGEKGSAVVLGHVDARASGKAVFYDLGRLRSGQEVDVVRRDHTVAKFKVDAVSRFATSSFPTGAVFGGVDYPGLRLITCGGQFDAASGHYLDNVVVFASMVGVGWSFTTS